VSTVSVAEEYSCQAWLTVRLRRVADPDVIRYAARAVLPVGRAGVRAWLALKI
jgi:hypothetical protein